ncbi:MAG: hypothetical protein MK180_12455 [Rhodobacteraceae bacterium]|nr:hypothetical protein [Paracoccaceae bacterium]
MTNNFDSFNLRATLRIALENAGTRRTLVRDLTEDPNAAIERHFGLKVVPEERPVAALADRIAKLPGARAEAHLERTLMGYILDKIGGETFKGKIPASCRRLAKDYDKLVRRTEDLKNEAAACHAAAITAAWEAENKVVALPDAQPPVLPPCWQEDTEYLNSIAARDAARAALEDCLANAD